MKFILNIPVKTLILVWGMPFNKLDWNVIYITQQRWGGSEAKKIRLDADPGKSISCEEKAEESETEPQSESDSNVTMIQTTLLIHQY